LHWIWKDCFWRSCRASRHLRTRAAKRHRLAWPQRKNAKSVSCMLFTMSIEPQRSKRMSRAAPNDWPPTRPAPAGCCANRLPLCAWR